MYLILYLLLKVVVSVDLETYPKLSAEADSIKHKSPTVKAQAIHCLPFQNGADSGQEEQVVPDKFGLSAGQVNVIKG